MTSGGVWQIGDTIADLYEVRGVNTEGGMATVYFVWHLVWRMELVIKSPKPALLGDEIARDRFLQEAETWVKLGSHPNIVTAYYARRIEGFPRIVIEKMNGGSLKQWLAQGKVPDLATALDTAIQIASGIGYTQKRQPGFVHRDLKPANVLMTPAGDAKVTDFGLVGAVGARVGTPAYMAPEVWTSPHDVTPAADLYSVGIVLYELLTGRRPFERGEAGGSLGQIVGGRAVEESIGALRAGTAARADAEADEPSLGARLDIQRVADRSLGEITAADVAEGRRSEDLEFFRNCHTRLVPDPPDRFAPGLPRDLTDLCMALVAKRAADRPASADEVIARLRRVYEASVGLGYPRPEVQEADLLADSLNNRALSFLDLDNEREALRCWQEALVGHPSHLETNANLGHWQWTHGFIDDAQLVTRLRDLERTHRDRREYWQALGMLQADRGDHEGATAAWSHAGDQANPVTVMAGPCLGPEAATTTPAPLGSLAVSLDGELLVAGGKSGWLGIFEAGSSLALVRTLGGAGAYGQDAVAFWGRPAIFAGTHGYDVILWRTDSGECVGCLKPPATPTQTEDQVTAQTLSALVVSADLSRLVAGYTFGMGMAGHQPIYIWDLSTGMLALRLEGHPDTVYALCLTPDGRHVVSAGLKTAEGYSVTLADFGTSRDRRPTLTSTSPPGYIKIWDHRSGACVGTFDEQTSIVRALALSPDGRLLVSGDHEGQVKLWDLASRTVVKTLLGHAAEVRAVTFLRDGAYVASAGEDRGIKIWDVASGRCVRTLEGHTDTVRALVWSPDADRLFSAGADRTVRAWTVVPSRDTQFVYLLSRPRSTGELLRAQSAVLSAGDHADACLARGDYAGAYALLREAQNVKGHEHDPEIANRLRACTAHGRRTGLRTAQAVADFSGYDDAVVAVACSPDGARVATSSKDGRVRVWHVELGTLAAEFRVHPHGVWALAWLLDGEQLVCCSRGAWLGQSKGDATIEIWHATSGRRHPVAFGHTLGLSAAAVLPDGAIVTGDWGERSRGRPDADRERNLVRMWDVASARAVRTWAGHEDALHAVAVSPDGGRIASASRDRTIRIWRLDAAEAVQVLRGHNGPVTDVAWSPDGRRLVSAGADDRVRLWDAATGACEHECVGHGDTVHAVVFTPDGRFVLSASEDRSLRVWDADSGQPMRTLEGHTDAATAIDLTPDGRYAVSGGYDRLAKLWELDWEWTF